MTYNYINNHRRGGKSFSDGRDELRNLQVYKQCAKWETTCRGWKKDKNKIYFWNGTKTSPTKNSTIFFIFLALGAV